MRSLFESAALGQLKFFDVPLGAFPVPWNLECLPGETRDPDGVCKPSPRLGQFDDCENLRRQIAETEKELGDSQRRFMDKFQKFQDVNKYFDRRSPYWRSRHVRPKSLEDRHKKAKEDYENEKFLEQALQRGLQDLRRRLRDCERPRPPLPTPVAQRPPITTQPPVRPGVFQREAPEAEGPPAGPPTPSPGRPLSTATDRYQWGRSAQPFGADTRYSWNRNLQDVLQAPAAPIPPYQRGVTGFPSGLLSPGMIAPAATGLTSGMGPSLLAGPWLRQVRLAQNDGTGHPSGWTLKDLHAWAQEALLSDKRPDCQALMPDRVAEDLGFKVGLATSGGNLDAPADLTQEEIEFIQDVQLCRAMPAPEKEETGIPTAGWIAIASAAAIGLVVALT